MGLLPHTPPKGTFCKIAIGDSRCACSAQREINPQIKTFGCRQLSGLNLLPRYQRPARMSPTRLRRRDALDQRIARLTRKIAIGDSLSAVQHLASLTRKSRPSVASNYQAGFCSQGIKNHRTCRLFAFGVATRLFSALRVSPAKSP